MSEGRQQSQPGQDLAALPVKNGFRLRGTGMTRTETFTDAAFAFAVTLLVISIEAVPTSYDELLAALRDIPAFAMSFVLLMLFWNGHRQWSRRFGLEDGPSIMLSIALVFILLVYVYPLKYLSTLFMAWISGGAFASSSVNVTGSQLHMIFAIYGTGFIAMAMIIVLLNLHGRRCRNDLRLNGVETEIARQEAVAWSMLVVVGTVSVLLALVTPPTRFMLPGWIYMLLAIAGPIYGVRGQRKIDHMIKAGE